MKVVPKTWLKVFFLVWLLSLAYQAYTRSAEFFVTSVIREVPLKNGDLAIKDFYINAGSNNGLKAGLYLDAVRRISAFDNINSKVLTDTQFKIARMQIIHTDKNVSIARLVKFYEKDKVPLGNYDAVMIGDLVEVSEKQ